MRKVKPLLEDSVWVLPVGAFMELFFVFIFPVRHGKGRASKRGLSTGVWVTLVFNPHTHTLG